MSSVDVGLGSNLGDRLGCLRAALDVLAASGTVAIERVSSVYETAPMEIAEQPAFLNAVAAISTALSPQALLALMKDTERAVGRVERIRFDPREVDLDIPLYGDLVLASEELTIPHRSLTMRAFALVPLDELVPGLVVPGTAVPVATMLPAALALGIVTLAQGPEW